jgi:hypothetical protein
MCRLRLGRATVRQSRLGLNVIRCDSLSSLNRLRRGFRRRQSVSRELPGHHGHDDRHADNNHDDPFTARLSIGVVAFFRKSGHEAILTMRA